ncbi:MAG: T9SS type A sorting domain-containing protein [candidate division Zixibacteria bacterium]|nr:T9SS type A sorting domain-containing protein [candidate division Zixibacteria bacterium]
MKKLALSLFLLVSLTIPSWGAIDNIPDYTLLWNRFKAVTVIDGLAVALAPEGVAVCQYNHDESIFMQINQLFLDDEPVAMKIHGDVLMVQTMEDSLVFVDISKLPKLAYLGGLDANLNISDFAMYEQNVYVSGWFDGIKRFALDDFNPIGEPDSSMKGVLVSQLHIDDGMLYALDEYNGILRFDITGDGFGKFIDYLLIPVRPSGFFKYGSQFMISATNDGLLLGEFGHVGSGIVDSIPDLSGPQRTLLTDDKFIFIRDRFVNIVDRNDWNQRDTISINNDLIEGDLFLLNDEQYLLLPGIEGGLVLYNLDNFIKPVAAFYRPGPINGLLLNGNHMFTGGKANPIDVYSLREDSEPQLDYTIYDELKNAVSIDHNGDTLIVLYEGLNKIAFFTNSLDPDDNYLESSIFIDNVGACDIEFIENWSDDLTAVLVVGTTGISAYTINDSSVVEFTATWNFVGNVDAAAVKDSLLFVCTGKRVITIYAITPDFELEYRSSITLSLPVYEMMSLHDHLVYFRHDEMVFIDCSNPEFPVTDDIVTLPVPVTSGVVQGNVLYTVGARGIGVFDISESHPVTIDYGGRPGTFLSADSNIVATSNGESIHIYFLEGGLPTYVEEHEEHPKSFTLSQNYPNPFNPHTWIDYSLPRRNRVRIEVFNILGEIVNTIVDGDKTAGNHTASWNGKDASGSPVSSGVYFYRLTAGTLVESRKMILVR